MAYSGNRKSLLIRLGLLILTTFLLTASLLDNGFFLTELVFLVLLGLQVLSFIKFIEKGEQSLSDFINSLRHDDLGVSYSTDTDDPDKNELNEQLNDAVQKMKEIRKEKEAEFQYMKNIVQHVGIGLITFDKTGSIQIMNTAAKKLLKLNHAEHIDDLNVVSEKLVDIFRRLRTGGRDLLRLEIGGDIVQMAVYAIELTLRGKEFKLVSIQNIQSELEEKEMEAWQNLVRVLTHEIMNSVTPISSLATMVESDLSEKLGDRDEVNQLTNEELEDIHLALQTINKRSQGLIRFVQDFRNLTHIPAPKYQNVDVEPLLNQLVLLLKKDIETAQVELSIHVDPQNLQLQADKDLIEQVIINLIQNACQAFDEHQKSRLVQVKAYVDEKSRPIISVKDNGTGIDDEALEKIFIPFFTTKKSGSGIGLSLSRQIMRQHKGMLGVKSKLDEGTEFFMRF